MAKRYTIGRAKECDIALADESVSRRHAELEIESGDRVTLADLGSSRGTFLVKPNGAQRFAKMSLSRNDTVRFGTFTIPVAELLASIPAAPTPEPAPVQPGKRIRCSCGAIKAAGAPCPDCGGVG